MPNDYKVFQKYYNMDRFNQILSDVLNEMNQTAGDEQYSQLRENLSDYLKASEADRVKKLETFAKSLESIMPMAENEVEFVFETDFDFRVPQQLHALKDSYDAMKAHVEEQDSLTRESEELEELRNKLGEKFPDLVASDYKVAEFLNKEKDCRNMDDETLKKDHPDVFAVRNYIQKQQQYSKHFISAAEHEKERKKIPDSLGSALKKIYNTMSKTENSVSKEGKELVSQLNDVIGKIGAEKDMDVPTLTDMLKNLQKKTTEYLYGEGFSNKHISEQLCVEALNEELRIAIDQNNVRECPVPMDQNPSNWKTQPSNSMDVEKFIQQYQDGKRPRASFRGEHFKKQADLLKKLIQTRDKKPVSKETLDSLFREIHMEEKTKNGLGRHYQDMAEAIDRFHKSLESGTNQEKDQQWKKIGVHLKNLEEIPGQLEDVLKNGDFQQMKTRKGRAQYTLAQNIRVLKQQYEFMEGRMENDRVLDDMDQYIKEKKEITNKVKELLQGKTVDEIDELRYNPELRDCVTQYNELNQTFKREIAPKIKPEIWQRQQIDDIHGRVKEFLAHKDDGKTASSNSKEYDAMITAMEKFTKKGGTVMSYEDFKEGLQDMKNCVKQYIEAKEHQFHPFSTKQGCTRMAYAKSLNQFLSVAEYQDRCLQDQVQQVNTKVSECGNVDLYMSPSVMIDMVGSEMQQKQQQPEMRMP
ncbi:MAG: hypothetical protein PUB10_08350 [Clostridiales bacterium]|nr:hypothetical protein [Clostridiales bacterium]